MRNGAKPAANIDLETAFLDAVIDPSRGDAAHVVHVRQRASLSFAAGKRDLEFAPETLSIGMSQHEFRCSLGIRRDIECFSVADAGQRARGYVSDRVAAGFTSRDPDSGKPPH